MAYPVFDLHCDTADRIGWATLDLDLRFTAGTDGYFPGDETHPQRAAHNAGRHEHMALTIP